MLILLMVLVSIAELVSLGLLIPFLTAISDPNLITANDYASEILEKLGVDTQERLIAVLTLIFIVFIIVSASTRILSIWAQSRISVSIAIDFSLYAYSVILSRPYIFHKQTTSSQILSGIEKVKNLSSGLIQPWLTIISGALILGGILSFLLLISPLPTVIAFAFLSLAYVLIVYFVKPIVLRNGVLISQNDIQLKKSIQESVAGIRQIILDETQAKHQDIFKRRLLPMQLALANNQLFGSLPKFVLESLGMALIATVGYLMFAGGTSSNDPQNTIPILGALAFGAQRLLPVTQQIYNAKVVLTGNYAANREALEILESSYDRQVQLTSKGRQLSFEKSIRFENVSFRYSNDSPWVLRELNLEILKGAKVGVIGKTGSGKSTLVDLLLGLLPPTKGTIYVDDIPLNSLSVASWRKLVANVPQDIFLFDDSVEQNIAIRSGDGCIDKSRLKKAVRTAQISNVIEALAGGYQTSVGERGANLSGGEKQRIGIARALYKESEVLVLDEATSALDSDTELQLMREIEVGSKEKTLIIVAHRLSTIKNCDQVIELIDGNVGARFIV